MLPVSIKTTSFPPCWLVFQHNVNAKSPICSFYQHNYHVFPDKKCSPFPLHFWGSVEFDLPSVTCFCLLFCVCHLNFGANLPYFYDFIFDVDLDFSCRKFSASLWFYLFVFLVEIFSVPNQGLTLYRTWKPFFIF